MNYRYLLLLLATACELAEKDPEGLAIYSCSHQVTGTDADGVDQVLLESSSEIDCVLSQEKNAFMEDTCSLDQSNYINEYSDVDCTWSCYVVSECNG